MIAVLGPLLTALFVVVTIGLCVAPIATRRLFASHPLNLTLASPDLN